MLSIAVLGYWVRCSTKYTCLKGDCCTSIFAKTALDRSAMKNQPTETHLTKYKVGLLTPRHLFGPY